MKEKNEKLIITPEYPSYIVRNFRTFLTYLSTHPIKLTKSNGYLTRKDLIAIYSQMKGEKEEVPSHATQTGYPIIHLFYHLSTVLEFLKVVRTPSSVMAVMDNQQVESFMGLTATEQYLTLLESFWMEANWNELHGGKRGTAPNNVNYLFEQLESIPANQEIELNQYREINRDLLFYGQFFYYFAYFGFWTFTRDEESDSKKSKRTIAKSITLTPFFKEIADALLETWDPFRDDPMEESLELFASIFNLPNELMNERELEQSEETESLITLLSPLFSKEELTTTLKKKPPSFKIGTYQFKVSLSSSCWRILQLTSSHTLLDLHDLIQKAFGFHDDHLYAFYMDGKKYSKHFYNSPMDQQGPYVNEVKLGELDLYEGQSISYLFDFGDEWEFHIHLLKISEEEEAGGPQIKETFGEAPDQYGW